MPSEAQPKVRQFTFFLTNRFEFAIFNNSTPQDKHYHKLGTEIYTLLEGEMEIEVNECFALLSLQVEQKLHTLTQGDTVIVNPGAIHLVHSKKDCWFLCQVTTIDCGGVRDKFVVD